MAGRRHPGRPATAGAPRIPPALSALLWPLSLPYGLVVRWKRRRFPRRETRLDVPVISVGNLTCGGTGKTPTVERIVRDLRALGLAPAILSRGYGAPSAGEAVNDEFRVLAENLERVPHLAGRDRVANGRRAIAAGADVLVLDDGFQHGRLARDLDIVLLDALRPFDNGRLLPAGLLREPKSALADADLVAISRCELVDDTRIAEISEEVELWKRPGAPIIQLALEAKEWRDVIHDKTVALEELRGLPVVHFSAIGNPRSFELAVASLGVDSREAFVFPDHHLFTRDDIARVAEGARAQAVDTVLCTQKDAVKLREQRLVEAMDGLRWLWLRVEQTVVAGKKEYQAALESLHK